MLHVNDDNSDELFRRAAENYPLKTDSADFDSVRKKLSATETDNKKTIVSRPNFKPLLLLLLLIPLKIYENKFTTVHDKLTGTQHASPATAKLAKNTPIEKPLPGITSTDNDQNLNDQTTQLSQRSTPVPLINNSRTNTKEIDQSASNRSNKGSGKNKRHISGEEKTSVAIKPALPEEDAIDNNETGKVKDEPLTGENDTGTVAAIPSIDKPLHSNNPLTDSLVKKDPVKKTEPLLAKTSEKKDKEKKNKREKHFYIGLAAGPDFSTIKLQSVKKTGFNYGFIAGYNINRKFSIEAGLFKDKKIYSTDGKYFSTKNIYLPGYADIEYVDGQCNMLELPINIYYNFCNRSNSSFFVSSGVSSYFMRNESYVYDINHSGVRYPKSASYDKKSTSLAAVINISAGYSYNLRNIISLRVEPYVKLPINKIGTGNLPIQSGGVTIAVTKKIF